MVHIIINGQGFIIFFRQISTDFNKLTLLLKIQLVIMWTSVSVFKDFRWITFPIKVQLLCASYVSCMFRYLTE